ncbi:hypothetical protein [Bradyrhizobium guangdongense]|uniref:Ribbon-helix-helix protein CopG domain-containing protein n=2 Tax=Bradyrhizobium guangdongense TaxID=1325090 RepID=A0ABX6UCQ5_9BRAD|nr:hypothetical protein [Bradyrhizobium guangdongense]QAU36887.1 hypothetical protein X265_03615 [Bradyrhizobium guangdongense]QOZ57939.1 hypothetical protein XH86_03610 [Bradyrhizobium guangdongense]
MADAGKSGSKRLPEGKRQMLCILDEDVIKRVKIAAVKSNARVSHVVEQALKQWLDRLETGRLGKF